MPCLWADRVSGEHMVGLFSTVIISGASLLFSVTKKKHSLILASVMQKAGILLNHHLLIFGMFGFEIKMVEFSENTLF